MRTRSDRLVAVATLGAFVVVAGVLGLVSIYLGAVTQALSGVQRSAPLPDYPGRPVLAAAEGSLPVRYLVLVNDPDAGLASAYLAQLAGGRDSLHLIGLPANLLVSDARGAESTLADRARVSGADAVRSVESLLGLRIDHLVTAELTGFAPVIDVIGGVDVDNHTEMSAEGWHFPAGELRLSSTNAEVYLSSSKQPMARLQRTESVLVQVLRGITGGDSLTNPAKVETIGTVLRRCVTVDAGLTAGEIRRTALDVHLGSDAISGFPVPLAGVSELNGQPVTVADTAAVAELRTAMQNDGLDDWAGRQADPWKPLATLPPR
ncbi:MAG: LCP family protein [Micropruina sp.]|uniref:LCP family protein n=1 Tax=Micropruina sp. TaxID=2737536 RepID=UPI0039E3E803